MNEPKPQPKPTGGPHFAGTKSGQMFPVAPGMRFRDKDGNVTVVPMPKKPVNHS